MPEGPDDEKRQVEDDEDEVCPEPVVSVKVPSEGGRATKAVLVKFTDDVMLSFEASPTDNTRALIDRAVYLAMAMFAFERGMSLSVSAPIIKEYLDVEVRGG